MRSMIVTTKISTRQLAELVKQVQAGNEVLLTQGGRPVARLVAPRETDATNPPPLHVRSLAGHRVLTPVIAQEDLAQEMFGR